MTAMNTIRRVWWRLRIVWLQRVRGRSGRFDRFNDPQFVKLCLVCFELPDRCGCDG